MLTIEALQQFGANTREGLGRCMNNETFYFKLIKMAVQDAGFGKLRTAVESGDLTAAFEAAHALKGVLGNLSLTPMYQIASDLTELLRAKTDMDYFPYLEKLEKKREELLALCQ